MEWGIVGHDKAVTLLRRAVQAGSVAHAYLLLGPRRIGKTTLALALAKALNCLAEDVPCQDCLSCRRITAGRSVDVRIVQAEKQNGRAMPLVEEGQEDGGEQSSKEIGIGQIRALQRDVALGAYEARYKVYIIRYAENLSQEAANCLLKTLEEPPPKVVLVLTAASLMGLIPTLISRCQQLKLYPPSPERVEAYLSTAIGKPIDEARRLSHLAAGRIGWAIDAAKTVDLIEERNSWLSRLINLPEMGMHQRFAQAQELALLFAKDRHRTLGLLELWMSWWRDLLFTRIGDWDEITNVDHRDELQRLTVRYTLGEVTRQIDFLRGTAQALAQNVNPRLAFEALMLRLPD